SSNTVTMERVSYLLLVAVLTLLGEPGLGIEDDLRGQERELEGVDVIYRCPISRRCDKEGGTCQRKGTCAGNYTSSCSSLECDCCLPHIEWTCNKQCSDSGTDGVCAVSKPPGGEWITHGPCEGGLGCTCYTPLVPFHFGGWSPVNPADERVQNLLEPLKQEVEKMIPKPVDDFKVISYRIVIVGWNIFAKVRISVNSNIHISVFSQPKTNILNLTDVWYN
ncbi:unnamed protein product, partial [Meganyctiphanes norvegica]